MKFPNCNVPLLGVDGVSTEVSRKLQRREPFSLIRLGDGEGALLALNELSTEEDREYFQRHFGPQENLLGKIWRLQSWLTTSIQDADIIGVRDDVVGVNFPCIHNELPHNEFLREFRTRFNLRPPDLRLPYEAARRIALLSCALAKIEFNRNQKFCSAWAHYGLQRSGALANLISMQNHVGLISCRKELPKILASSFGVDVDFYHIPCMFKDTPKSLAPTNQFDRLEELLETGFKKSRGILYLVGEGLFGKVYCSHIKKQGGVALDLGSLLDAWVGLPTRPAVYQSMFADDNYIGGVPASLLLDRK